MIGRAFQVALASALTGAGVTGGRIYDQVPEKPTFPYTTIGDEQVIDDGNSCDDGWLVFSDVHIWSQPDAGSKLELKDAIAQAVPAVTGITSVTGFAVISVQLENSLSRRETDGLTEHAVLTFRTLLTPAA